MAANSNATEAKAPSNTVRTRGGATESATSSSIAEIVGVVGDVKYLGLARAPEPAFYVPLTQDVNPVFLVVRSTVSAASVAQEVRTAIKSIGNDVVFIRMNTSSRKEPAW